MAFQIITPQQFHNHILAADAQAFEQSPQMALLLKKRGYRIQMVGYVKDNDIKVSALVFSTPIAGGLAMEINNGPIVTDPTYLEDFYKGLQNFSKQEGAIELKVKPYDNYQILDSNGSALSEENQALIDHMQHLGFQHSGLEVGYHTGDWNYVKDLSQLTPETLFKSFSKKGRPLVKKAKTFGIKIKKLERSDLAIFKEITSATSDRRDFDDKPLEYYEYLFDSFGDKAEFVIATLNFQDYLDNLNTDQAKLKEKIDRLANDLEKNPNSEKKQNQYRELSSQFETFDVRKKEAQELINQYGQNDTPLCASLFLYLEKEAFYLYSGSYSEFNRFYAPAILQEYAMLEAMKRGLKRYNFLGIKGVFDGTDSILRFKQNFEGYIEHKPGYFLYHPHPLKHKTYQFIKKLLGRN
ncbi:aminoacyltransferase [Streptococcus porcorum]|uniref:Aminoacyltransferase FemA n=1 Tax=Streptococcus porcorum TaxID=701526 RepID=A0ABV2JEH2_9STRE